MQTVFLKSNSRFGFGVDVYYDAAAVEIDIAFGKWTLTLIFDK